MMQKITSLSCPIFLLVTVSTEYDNIVKIKDELKLCLDYLEMQKIRYGEALQFHIDIPEKIVQTGFVPVFSLQLLSENAIKHNALTNETPLTIKIIYKEERIMSYQQPPPKTDYRNHYRFGLDQSCRAVQNSVRR